MFGFTKRLALSGLLAAGFLIATGCERGSSQPPIDSSAVVGSWIEVAEAVKPNPRMRDSGPKENLRYITLKADNTFEFTLRSASGGPLKDAKKIQGTWKLDTAQNEIVFEVTNNEFSESDERSDWAPELSSGITKRDIAGEGVSDVLVVVDVGGAAVRYKHAQ